MPSFDTVAKRADAEVFQLRDALQLNNEKQLADINENLLSLQRESLDDSDTVKIITILTLLYLPGMFVAVSGLRQCESLL